MRQPVDGCEGAGSRCACIVQCLSCPPRLSQGLFFCTYVNTFFFFTLGLHTVLLASLTRDGLLFQDFIETYSARGLAAVFTETGVHGALDRDRGHLIFAELVQATARVDAQLLTVAGSGQWLLSLCSTICSCDVLGGGKLQVVM